MTNVLTFETAVSPPETPERLRLHRLSRALSTLFAVLMGLAVAWVLWLTTLIFFFDQHLSIGPESVRVTYPAPVEDIPGRVILANQPFITHIAGVVNIALATTPVYFIFRHMHHLFRLYANGIVFARDNATHLKRVGQWLVIYPFAKFSSNMIFQAAGGTDKAWFSFNLVYALILGAIVFVIAQVMEFGHEIEQDRAEII